MMPMPILYFEVCDAFAYLFRRVADDPCYNKNAMRKRTSRCSKRGLEYSLFDK